MINLEQDGALALDLELDLEWRSIIINPSDSKNSKNTSNYRISACCAFFLDFDGTLVELAPTPAAVKVTSRLRTLLAELLDISDGATAIISGRSIETLDTLLTPLKLPIAGLHGAERRSAAAQLMHTGFHPTELQQIACELKQIVDSNPGMLLEEKGAALALHFRNAPGREPLARRVTERLVARYSDIYALQPGKMVFEIKPKEVNKQKAIEAFLDEPPFAGRPPFFAGDDLTDEQAFAWINQRGGWSVKVGDGDTVARIRLDSVNALLAWLQSIIKEIITQRAYVPNH